MTNPTALAAAAKALEPMCPGFGNTPALVAAEYAQAAVSAYIAALPQMDEELLARLTTMYSHRGDGFPTQYVNPDGQAAADTITRLCHELGEARGAWQPIEAIPRDGTWVLVAPGHYGGEPEKARAGTDGQPFTGDWGCLVHEATLWMPLPAPPKDDKP